MTACVECPRDFLFVHGDPGQGDHSLGDGLRTAAETHRDEIEAGTFPFDVPKFRKDLDRSHVAHVSRVAELASSMAAFSATLHYLAIYSHMGAGGDLSRELAEQGFIISYSRTGLLFLGDASAPDTNLGKVTSARYIPVSDESKEQLRLLGQEQLDTQLLTALNANNTGPEVLPRSAFFDDPKTQVRLFGCYGAVGQAGDPDRYSIAESLANALGRKVYGFSNEGGSMMTDDQSLGHGKRRATRTDQQKTRFSSRGELWFVPFLDRVAFQSFGP
jgi:hypothetical protein